MDNSELAARLAQAIGQPMDRPELTRVVGSITGLAARDGIHAGEVTGTLMVAAIACTVRNSTSVEEALESWSLAISFAQLALNLQLTKRFGVISAETVQ